LKLQPEEYSIWHSPDISPHIPKISVIIPCLQEEKLLPLVLASLPSDVREGNEIEVIVSDGGSTDSSIEIAKSSADTIVKFNATRKQTIAEGRNAGASVARGSTLVFLNADTLPSEPHVFFPFIFYWTLGKGKFNQAIALGCPVEVNPSQRKWSDVLFHSFFNVYLKLLSLLGFNVARGECQIIRTDTFNQCGGYDNSLTAGEDFELFSRLGKQGSTAIANELLVYESPRRYRKFGYRKILLSWFLNWFGAQFFRKSISKDWEPVR
jgi:glycosyltransferase involved in cell wall biosynthesis